MATTLEVLSAAVAGMLGPLEEAGSRRGQRALLAKLGWTLPPGVDDLGLGALDPRDLDPLLAAVANPSADERDHPLALAARYVELLAAASRLIDAIHTTAAGLRATLGGAGDYLARTRIADELPRRLLDYLIVEYLAARAPAAEAVLRLAGIIERVPFVAEPTEYRTAHLRCTTRPERLAMALTKPERLARELYRWGAPEFQPLLMLSRTGDVLAAFGGDARVRELPRRVEEKLVGRAMPEADTAPWPQLIVSLARDPLDAAYDAGLSLVGLRPSAPGGVDGGVAIVPYARGAAALVRPLAGTAWSLELDGGADVQGGVQIVLRPDAPVRVETGLRGGAAAAKGRIGLGLRYTPAGGEPARLLSFPGGSELGIARLAFRGGAIIDDAGADAFVELELGGGRLALELGEAGSFLAQLVSVSSLVLPFDVRVIWSERRGLHFEDQAGLELDIPLAVSAGPLHVDLLHLALGASDGGVALALAVTGGLQLGPVAMTVEGLGVQVAVRFERGNLGVVDLTPQLIAPTGLGLAIDASWVAGGGFLSRRGDSYAGVLQVSVQDVVDVTVIGLLTTRNAVGGEIFSLRLFGSAQFSPIQLGFGFSLSGIGVAIAIESGMDAEALRRAVYEGSLRSLLFPPDPVANATQVIAELAAFFPPREGCTVVGVMAQLGWGAGAPLLTADVGIFVELSRSVRVVLAGIAYAALPSEHAPVLVLNVQLLGVLDLDAKTVAIDTSLRGSRLLGWALDGGAALRAGWGDRPGFALSAGGFYPGYKPPADFPRLDRIALTIGSGNPHVVLYSYFAITENSVQIGAELLFELRKRIGLGFGSVTIEVAGSTGFDAIARFDPFRFEAEMHGCFAVRCDGDDLLAIALRLMLRGPNPYHVQGTLRFDVFGFGVELDIDETFGGRLPEVPPAAIDPVAVLETELAKPANWRVAPAAARSGGVVLEAAPSDGELTVDASASLRFDQHALPLGIAIEQLGYSRVTKATYALELAIGEHVVAASPIEGDFAPGAFLAIESEAERLALPPFVRTQSGVGVEPPPLGVADVVTREAAYEQILLGVDAPPASPSPPAAAGTDTLRLGSWTRGGLAAYARYDPEQLRAKLAIHAWVMRDGARVSAVPVTRTMWLRGPGDIAAFDPQGLAAAISRVVPAGGQEKLVAGHFPFIEFTEPDFPWRYSPVDLDPATGRLKPWLALIVLETGSFALRSQSIRIPAGPGKADQVREAKVLVAGNGARDTQPLPSPAALDGLALWASTQLGAPSSAGAVAGTCSRLLCPIELERSKAYTAFLVPAFEVGRLAGLGKRSPGVDPRQYWAAPVAAEFELPVYHSWSFETDTAPELETLVRKLRVHWPPAVAETGSPAGALAVELAQVDGTRPGYFAAWQPNRPGGSFPLETALLPFGCAVQPFDSASQFAVMARRAIEERPTGIALGAGPVRLTLWQYLKTLAEPRGAGQLASSTTRWGRMWRWVRDLPRYKDPRRGRLERAVRVPVWWLIVLWRSLVYLCKRTWARWTHADDPLLTIPCYGDGYFRSLRSTMARPAVWPKQLNLDRRYRVAAAVGAGIVRSCQDDYVAQCTTQLDGRGAAVPS